MFTGVYQQDVKLARQLNLFTGVNPKKTILEGLIADYLSTTNEDSDRPIALLPKPTLKKDRIAPPKPVLKKDRKIDPLKRPTEKPVLKKDRIAPKPKLNKFNRSLFQ